MFFGKKYKENMINIKTIFTHYLHCRVYQYTALYKYICSAPDDCWREDEPYTGQVTVTETGRPCIRWEYLIGGVTDIDLDHFPDRTWDQASNYCRLELHVHMYIYHICWLNQCVYTHHI